MKLYEFINIISGYFSTQIPPDSKTKRVKDSLRYQTVLSWFTDSDADEIEQVNRVLMKSDNFCNKLLNGNSEKDMPITDANYLKGKVTTDNFFEVFENANLSDESIEKLIIDFQDKGHTITETNIVDDITNVLIDILNERSNTNKKGSIKNAVFIGNDKLKVGKKTIVLPAPLQVPNLPTKKENKYINALFEVYSQKISKPIAALSDLDTEPIYKTNLQLHREFYYSAESVLHQIRDFFSDSVQEFNNMKQEVYDAIKYNISLAHKDGFEKLNSTMDIVIKVTFSKSFFAKSGNGFIGPSEKSGMVHMLVNDGKVIWV
jgi:hypothetical protein